MAGASTRRTERLLTLVFVMLGSRRGVSRDRLREVIPDYAASASEQAFERMFERDKESLRELGIPVETVQLDSAHDDEWGYRIDPRAYELPAVAFTTDELIALDIAARAWKRAALEGVAAIALRKLESTGLDVPDDVASVPVETRLGVSEPAFADLMGAIIERRPVQFDYRKPGGDSEHRSVEPWGLVLRRGSAYLVAHDTDRDDRRVFRVSRIEGTIARGHAGVVTVPEGVDLRALVGDGEPETFSGNATLRVVPGRAMSLRRMANAEPDDLEITVPFRSLERFEREVAAYGPDVVVLAPPQLRSAVIRRLEGSL